jgi:poly-gamma-glutamate capsule biosynthesis protein CapA/YwtB (metallophosphatase superfamily)
MHGAPLLHGVEIYRDRPIFFDLGNFIFQTALANVWEPIAWESVVAYVDFAGTTLKSIKFRPIVVEKIGQSQADTRNTRTNNLRLQTSGLPRVATGEQAYTILQRLADLSRPFGTNVEINGEMAAVKLKAGN